MNSELYIRYSEQLSFIENNYPVYEWELNGIQYWPILKNLIFFRKNKKRSFREFIKSSIFATYFKKWKFQFDIINNNSYLKNSLEDIKELSEIEYLFSGAITHSRLFKNKDFNIYFDPIMDQLEDCGSALYVNYSSNVNNHIYKRHRVLDIYKYYPKYHNKRIKKLTKTKKLSEQLKIVCDFFQINEDIITKELLNKLESILSWKDIWLNVLINLKPKISFGICYYNEPMYGLIMASREKNIPFVDMQHGGQGDFHPAYFFSKFPKSGNNSLPFCFWLWDDNSKNNIEKWISYSSHLVIEGGNPWIDYLKLQKNSSADTPKKKIICTLTIGLKSILPDYLLNSILNSSDEFIWYLRFHPRTKLKDKNELYMLVDKYKISRKIDLANANTLQLPELLMDAWAHVSHSSGSLIEAALLGVKNNIITSEIGVRNHHDLIDSKKALYYNPDIETDTLINFIKRIDEKHFVDNTINLHSKNYNFIINEIIEKFNQTNSIII